MNGDTIPEMLDDRHWDVVGYVDGLWDGLDELGRDKVAHRLWSATEWSMGPPRLDSLVMRAMRASGVLDV